MKKLIYGLTVLMTFGLIICNLNITGTLEAASFSVIESTTITSVGITGFNFTKVPQEIYIINYTTTGCRVNWTSSTTVVLNNFALGTIGTTDVIWTTVEGRSSSIAVRQDTGPVHIFIQGRWGW